MLARLEKEDQMESVGDVLRGIPEPFSIPGLGPADCKDPDVVAFIQKESLSREESP